MQIVGISPDTVEVLNAFSESAQIGFPLLSDEQSQAIHAFRLHFERGLPHPGTLLVDRQGIVRAKLFRAGYRDRHSNQELINAVKSLQ